MSCARLQSLSPEEEAAVEALLLSCAALVQTRGVVVKSYFRDFDRHGIRVGFVFAPSIDVSHGAGQTLAQSHARSSTVKFGVASLQSSTPTSHCSPRSTLRTVARMCSTATCITM
jgi:hypothetical protein